MLLFKNRFFSLFYFLKPFLQFFLFHSLKKVLSVVELVGKAVGLMEVQGRKFSHLTVSITSQQATDDVSSDFFLDRIENFIMFQIHP